MKALITGGNGFIGSHLVDALVARDCQVVVFDRNDRLYDTIPPQVQFIQGDFSQCDSVVSALKDVDVLFHLSWESIHDTSNQDPAGDVIANLVPTINLIEACHQAGTGRLVFVSSGGTVYGVPKSLPVPESHPQDPISAYGISKLAVEKYLQLFHRLHGTEYVIFRPSVPFGPRQNPLGQQGAVAKFLHHVAHGLTVTIWGDGSVSRDYFYVSDLVDALIAGAEHELGKQRIFNIGGPEAISLLQLLRHVEDVVGRKGNVQFAAPRRFDVPAIWLDTRMAQQELGWRTRIPVQEGLVRTWQWMKSTIDCPA